MLHIDALVLNADGSALDALSLGAKCALADVRLPKVSIVPGASADEPAEIELDDEAREMPAPET